MNSEITMSVSSMTRNKDNKAIYILFSDGNKSAEFSIPETKLLNNKGFTDEEIEQLSDYINNEKDYIYSIAKKVSPIKGFMGEKQG